MWSEGMLIQSKRSRSEKITPAESNTRMWQTVPQYAYIYRYDTAVID